MTVDAAWLELTLEAREHRSEVLEDALLEAGACAVTLSDAADEPILEPAPGATPLWSRTRVTGLFDAQTDIEQVKHLLCALLGCAQLPEAQLHAVEERDWVRAWMDHFHPMRFGERLWVVPSCRQPPDPDAVNLLLDPGLAFGTGTHPTTALCLEWLDAAELAGRRVIDYGCGSGILAIAALKLGAHTATAIDIDPQALIATRENAAVNQVDHRLRVGKPEALGDVQVDVVLANILAGPLMLLAPRLAALTRPGGHVVLAGLLERHADEVEAAYAPWFELQPRREREGWTRLHGIRRG
ncbi:[LSU ribosomal protein L11P]-lysine N-methyltransferase [Plasticicumulans lactativorans]|uniref:Ribosomal protein L11 methyltransferase n=1 Tax=Plasticicumulans lactativorans TaxID=1133106 RepID=A0A4R2LQ03_9GAMM|nr:50S ribosomal protein L11 methyltransferase [Plasticicumulans lactativorans]TCO81634.1 [LSU ribosomal protein L11P]-lysine N-methyltransferase [Plasticicumulans lactativorans]